MLKIFTPPTFSDSENTRKARLFFNVVWCTCGIMSMVLTMLIISVPQYLFRYLYVVGVLDSAGVGLLLLNRKGYTRLASILFIALVNAVILVSAWSAGGIDAPGFRFFPVLILIAVLLLGWKEGVITGLVAIIGGLGLVAAEGAGVLPVSQVAFQPLQVWIFSIGYIGLIIFLQFVSMASLDKALRRAQQELLLRKEGEHRIQSINDHFTAGMIYQVVIKTDGTRRFTYLSDSVHQLYGISPAEGMADPMLIYCRIHEDDIETLKEAEEAAVKTFSTFKAEARMKDPSGAIRWSSFVSTPKRMEDGSTCFDGIEFIITERKRTEEALRASERKSRALFDLSFGFIGLLTPDGTLLDANKTALEFAGVQLSDVVGKPFWETPWWSHSPEMQQRLRTDLKKAASGRSVRTEMTHVSKDGSLRTIDFTLNPVMDETGRVTLLIPEGRDITQRKQAEEALRVAHEQLVDIMDSVPDPTFVIDQDKKVIVWNHAIEVLSGVPKEKMLGKGDYAYAVPFFGKRQPILIDLLDAPPTEIDAAYKFVKTVGDTLYAESFLPILYQGKGAHLWGVAAPLYDRTGKRWGAIEVIRDVSDRIESEKRLLESEEKFRALFENAGDAIFIMQDDRFLDCNVRTLEMFGCQTVDQIVGHPPYEFSPAIQPNGRDSRDLAIEKINAALSGQPQIFEWMHAKLDSTPFPAEVSLNRVDVGGKVLLQAIVRDITERKRAEEALQESEEKFRSIVQGLTDLIIIVNQQGIISYLSPSVYKKLGYPAEEMIGKNPLEFIHHEDTAIVSKELGEVFNSTNEGLPTLYRAKHKNGAEIYIESVGINLLDNKAVNGVVVFGREVTERIKTEKTLEESEERFRQIAENIQEIFFLYEKEGDKLLYISPVISSLFGVSPEMAHADRALIDKVVHPDDLSIVDFIHPESFYAKPLDEEFRILRPPDQEVRWVRLRSFLVHDEQGNVVRVAGLAADITDLKNSQEQARQQQIQLVQADKMATLGVLVSGIAHEINNPNNLVMFNCDLVSRIAGDVSPILDEYYEAHPERTVGGLSFLETRKEFEGLIKGISIGSQRIRDIVAGLKDFARIDAGNLQQKVRINEAVKSALLIVGNLIRKSTDHFSVEYDKQIQTVPGNILQIEQVIINLLTNACQALPDRKRAVHVRTELDTSHSMVRIVVSDEGVGISRENLKRMFDPFFTTKREQGGTGLGLSVSYSIIQAHNGDLQVESEEGKGTTVTLSLPAARSTEAL